VLLSTPVGRTLGKVIHRLSNTSNQGNRNGEDENGENVENEEKPEKPVKSGWTYRLTKPFVKPEPTTPDFNKDVENMVLR